MAETIEKELETAEKTAAAADQPAAVSPQKRNANRKNSRKSTGPRTARGKAHSRRNALTHGLTAKSILFGPDGTPVNEELHVLWDKLHDKFGDDVVTILLLDTVVVECWRQGKALDSEIRCLPTLGHFGPQGYLPNLQRYRTASQRALTKTLELLAKQGPSTAAAEEGDCESNVITIEAENQQEPKLLNASSTAAAEENPPESSLDQKAAGTELP
jgi:hypothetical protein